MIVKADALEHPEGVTKSRAMSCFRTRNVAPCASFLVRIGREYLPAQRMLLL